MASETLDSVFQSLHNSVLEAQKLTEQQHLRQLRRYFSNRSDQDLGMPRMLELKVPNLHPSKKGDLEWRTVQIPNLAVVSPSSIGIKELRMHFSVRLMGFDNPKVGKDPVTGEDHPHAGALDAGFGGSGGDPNVAEIDIAFEQGDPPEALLRIADLLNKTLP